MVNAFAPWTDYQFVTVPELHTLQDLAGKALGVSRIGSVSYLAPVYVLQHAGVDISTIRFVAVGNDAARGRAIAARTIQGAVINGLDASRTLQADPSLHIIADVGSAFREVAMSNATFARGDFIKSQPAALQKVVTVLIQAARELQSNEAAAVAEALKVGLPADATQATYDRLYHAPVPYYGVDGGLDPVAIDSTVQLLKSSGGIDKTATLTAAQIVDPQFTAATLKALGPYGK
jgi:NitT/TauT family transport system substrate-binding protein